MPPGNFLPGAFSSNICYITWPDNSQIVVNLGFGNLFILAFRQL